MTSRSVAFHDLPADDFVCPLCGGTSSRTFVAQGIPVDDCLSCSHRFAAMSPADDHVASVYGAGYFHGAGAGYVDYLAKSKSLRRQGGRYGELLRFHGLERGRLLDIGAAAGFLLQGFCESGWAGVGLEPSASMVEHGRSALGVDLRHGTLEDADDLDLGRFDVVSMIQVLAHFVDPRHAVAAARRLLVPGGHCLIETWDRQSLTARGFGSRWHEYDPPSVLHWFSREGVAALFVDEGFRVVASGRARKSIDGLNARGVLNQRLGRTVPSEGRRQGRTVVDRLEVPYPGDDAFWMLVSRVD